MLYKFKCMKCGKEQTVEMKLSEYTSYNHICEDENCKGRLVRDISHYAGGAVWNTTGSYARTSI